MFSLILYLLYGLVFLLVLVFLTVTGYLHYVHWKYSHIPQPKRPSFYLGHLSDLSRDGDQQLYWVPVFLQWLEMVKCPIFVVFFFKDPIIFITDPESVQAVAMQSKLRRHPGFTKSFFVQLFGERLAGHGILTIPDSETWKPRRQLYDPAFRKSYLMTQLVSFNEETNKIIEQLKPLADGVTSVPMKACFGDYVQNVISKVGFGMDLVHEQINGQSTKALRVMMMRGFEIQIRFPGYKYLHPFEAAKYRKAVRDLRAIGRECIRERIQAIESDKQTPNDILTHILRMASTKEGVDIVNLVDDFIAFYIAGQDSTMSLLIFALVQILRHPNVLERVQQEVDEVLGNKTSVNEADFEKLEYTEQVLKETLRLHAPFFASFPKETPPEGMTLNDYHIPGGTQVMLSSAMISHMSEYFDNPETFNPERFGPESARPNSFTYFPFGVGPRSCIGKNFAMMNAKVVFSRLIQTYKFSLPENYELVIIQKGALQPKDDVHCVLENRKMHVDSNSEIDSLL